VCKCPNASMVLRGSQLDAVAFMDRLPSRDDLQMHWQQLLDKTSQRLRDMDTQLPVLSVIALLALVATTATLLIRRRSSSPVRPATPRLEKGASKASTPSRKPGEWPPSTFKIPIPPPYPNWSVTTTLPLPYRPFRHGPNYFITMGLRSAPFNSWIELDNQFPKFHALKTSRIASRGTKCCRTAPEAYDAALELLDELTRYLPARYPTLYRRTLNGIQNLWNGEELHTDARPLPEDPMQMCARLVQDDLAIMIERPDGQYYLLAGAILLAGFWRLEDKFGMPLSEIHTSGDVPQFREKLEKGMMNFFRRLKPEEMVARNNYFLQVDDGLDWSASIGDEDGDEVSWNTAQKDRAIENHWFRSERQTLRRLPRSGGVVFTIRTYFHPVTEIVREDYVPGRLASAVRSWGEDVGRYKGREKYKDVLLEFLDMKHAEQVERGLEVEREEETRAYPW
jgi:hypothetical protein